MGRGNINKTGRKPKGMLYHYKRERKCIDTIECNKKSLSNKRQNTTEFVL